MKAELGRPGAPRPGDLQISPMLVSDIPEVTRIEQLSFSTVWPPNAFHNEVKDNKLAHYFVGRIGARVVAYGGLWVILEDSHITTIAVHPEMRGLRMGERMLAHLIDEAIVREASWITLEVRESNLTAQNLYAKYGFTVVSTRRGYYSDNNENALVMWAGNLKGEIYRNRFRALKEAMTDR
ncbi:MAG TPA: ribosomal protein S18-alanine N-acetyltransferase [Candidatus Dormibacteraeota bacterium]|nr:ribosomal protein S18-alanine N-acetyltransferase [Candidatus Dormibacteraeota bacterium]